MVRSARCECCAMCCAASTSQGIAWVGCLLAGTCASSSTRVWVQLWATLLTTRARPWTRMRASAWVQLCWRQMLTSTSAPAGAQQQTQCTLRTHSTEIPTAVRLPFGLACVSLFVTPCATCCPSSGSVSVIVCGVRTLVPQATSRAARAVQVLAGTEPPGEQPRASMASSASRGIDS